MSFMSDSTDPLYNILGKDTAFASEGAFLARLHDKPEERHSYWINAKKLLKTFLEQKNPSAVGLQEMNLTKPDSNTGTDAINSMLQDPYKQISDEIRINEHQAPALTIIYNTEKVGELEGHMIVDNGTNKGRPLLMALTNLKEKYYLLACIHGDQNPTLTSNKDEFNRYIYNNNVGFLKSNIEEFLATNGVAVDSLAGIFIMGDFNDRYDAITEIVIGERTLNYNGTAPKSCCYNWDSSCPDGENATNLGDGYVTCKVPEKIKDESGRKLSLGDRGAVKNYRYAGDKVFGLNPNSDIVIFSPQLMGWDGISTESDHELVYASFQEPEKEGGLKSGGKNKKSKKRQRTIKRRKGKKTRKSNNRRM
jgi:hypothetical protein